MAVDYAALKKGGFMRQKQKNHFSLRLAVVGGNLTAENLKIIAEVAEKYGDGHVHLTSRQSVEIPFIKLEQVEEVNCQTPYSCRYHSLHIVTTPFQQTSKSTTINSFSRKITTYTELIRH